MKMILRKFSPWLFTLWVWAVVVLWAVAFSPALAAAWQSIAMHLGGF